MRRPHGGHVIGASPQIPFAGDLTARQGDLVCPQDQLLDLRMIQSWYQSGALKGGLWLPDWAYQEQSVGTAVTAAGQVVGVWAPAASTYSATQTTTANKPLSAITPVTGKPWLNADSTDVLPVVFPADVGKCYWTEVAGQLASQINIRSLAVFNNKLYGGTASNGKLFEWNGTNAWVEVAGQLNSQTQMLSIAVFNSKLYGSTAPNGRLFEWNGTNAWVEVAGQLSSQINIRSLVVFNNKLYGGTAENGKLFEWNGANAWVEVAGQLSSQTYILSLAIFNNKLYGSTYPNGKLFEWNGTNAWVEVAGQLSSQTSVYSLAVFNNKLYGGTYPNGKLFEWNGSNAWVEVAGQLASQTYILSLAVFNNRLYGSTYPTGKLFEWNGTNAWVEVAGQLNSQTNVYSLAVFNSNLYGGTGETGRLFEFSRNACTIARATPTGVTFDESQIISTTWNDLIQPYQYNSAVLVADRQLNAREKAIVSRVLGAYVPALGANLISNGTFDIDTMGWSPRKIYGVGDVSVTDGVVSIEGNGVDLLGALAQVPIEAGSIGTQFYVTARVRYVSGGTAFIRVTRFSHSSQTPSIIVTSTSFQLVSYVYSQAVTTGTGVLIGPGTTTGVAEFDDIVMREIS